MAQTLYRKYRPKLFSDLSGQDHIKVTIQSEIINNCLAHAFLFCGPRGIGKTSMARLIAKTINCLNRKENEAEPCNTCNNCLEITQGRSLDIVEIDAASQTGVDNVRENIIANAKIGATTKKFKVFIIDEVHMLSTSSFNALLKTLEEPNSKVIFILATTEVHKIPKTIISRCQRFDFQKIEFKKLVERLEYIVKEENRQCQPEVLNRVAYLSQGYLRDAVSLLGQVLSLPDTEIDIEKASLILPSSRLEEIILINKAIVSNNIAKAITIVNNLLVSGADLSVFYTELIEVWRNLLLLKLKAITELNYSEKYKNDLKDIVDQLDLKKIVQIINILLANQQKLNKSGLIQLPLELALVQIYQLSVKDESNDVNNKNTPNNKYKNIVQQEANGFKAKQNVQGSATQTSPKPVINESKALYEDEPIVNSESTNINVDAKSDISTYNDESITTENIENSSFVIDFNTLISKWAQILEEIKASNHSLSIVLNTAKPTSVEGNELTIAFPYSFYKKQLDEHRNKVVVQEVASKHLGGQVRLNIVVDENIKSDEINSGEAAKATSTGESADNVGLDDLAQALGGSVVE